jgi:hypothetical protein
LTKIDLGLAKNKDLRMRMSFGHDEILAVSAAIFKVPSRQRTHCTLGKACRP